MRQSSAARRLAVVPARPKIVAPYERVSAVMGRDDEAFRSPDIQRRATLEVIAAAGAVPFQDALDNPERYRDIDSTGRDFNRDGIQRLFELKRAGVIDGIAVLDVSRVGRTTSETLAAIETFREGEHGVFLSARERIDDSPQGDWMLANLVSMAQLYSDNIAQGWRTVIEVRAEKGLHNGAPPLGYRWARVLDPVSGVETAEIAKPRRIVIDPLIAPLVLDVFERYALGASARELARELHSKGAGGRSGMRELLSNPFYVGRVRLYAYTGRAKKRVKLKGVEPFVTDGQHDAIVPDELFERVQQRLARTTTVARRHVVPVHALAGLATCEHGRALVHQRHKRSGAYLRVSRNIRQPCCGAMARVDELEALVKLEVLRVLRFDVDDHASSELVRQRAAALVQRDEIERELAKREKALGDADADFYSGDLTRERHAAVTSRLLPAIERLRAKLDELPCASDVPDEGRLVAARDRLVEVWDDATPSERNELLRACGVQSVTVRPSSSWREPLAARATIHFAI